LLQGKTPELRQPRDADIEQALVADGSHLLGKPPQARQGLFATLLELGEHGPRQGPLDVPSEDRAESLGGVDPLHQQQGRVEDDVNEVLQLLLVHGRIRSYTSELAQPLLETAACRGASVECLRGGHISESSCLVYRSST